MAVKQLVGLYEIIGYRSWKITWPYRSEKYILFGSKAEAVQAAKKLQNGWTYSPSIREIKL